MEDNVAVGLPYMLDGNNLINNGVAIFYQYQIKLGLGGTPLTSCPLYCGMPKSMMALKNNAIVAVKHVLSGKWIVDAQYLKMTRFLVV
jgi:hypothetical protein